MTKKKKEEMSDVEKGCGCLLILLIIIIVLGVVFGSIALIIWKICEIVF